MFMQEKVQGNQRMTRANLILAKSIGTLYSIGVDGKVISELTAKANEPEREPMQYLKDHLLAIRSGYSSSGREYESLSRLISDCSDEISRKSAK